MKECTAQLRILIYSENKKTVNKISDIKKSLRHERSSLVLQKQKMSYEGTKNSFLSDFSMEEIGIVCLRY